MWKVILGCVNGPELIMIVLLRESRHMKGEGRKIRGREKDGENKFIFVFEQI